LRVDEIKQDFESFNFQGGEKVDPEMSEQEEIDLETDMDEHEQVVDEETGITLGEVYKGFQDKEIGMSRLFTRINKHRFCYNTSLGEWWIYRDCCWQEDKRQECIDACRDLYDFLTRVKTFYLQGISEEEEEMAMKQISSMTNHSKMVKILEQSAAGKDGLGVPGELFDNIPSKLGAPNGIIDLETGELHPDNPELYITRQIGIPYDAEAAEPVVFKRFLKDTFRYPLEKGKTDLDDDEFYAFCEEQSELLINYLQRLFGYAALGTCREHVFICFWGIGRNGKGVLVRTINRVLGDYAGEIQPSILVDSKITSADSPTPAVGDLQGMRLVVASETNQGEFFDTSQVKRLTGGDTLVYRKPYAKDFVRFRPTHTLILQTNFRPNAPAEDIAFWDRMHVVPFLRRFIINPDPDNPYESMIDLDLEDNLTDELPGILQWVVEGARKYREQGLNPPQCVHNAVETYRQSRDYISDFIDECCIVGDDFKVRTTAFAKAINEWRKVCGFRSPMSSPVITERLEYKGFSKGKSNYMIYKGLCLNADGEEYLKPQNERYTGFENNEPPEDPASDNPFLGSGIDSDNYPGFSLG